MSLSDGVAATAANFNAAFLSRTQNSTTIGIPTLNNSSDPNSGAQVTNPQRAINELFDADGTAGEGDAARKNYASNNYVTDGSSRKTAIEQLDAALFAVATSGSGGVNQPEIEIRTLSAGEITAKQIVLASAPLLATKVVFDVRGYPPQFYTLDYTVAGAILSWSGLPLDGLLIAGDVVKATYYVTPAPELETRVITAGEVTAESLTLLSTPTTPSKVVFEIEGLPGQYYGLDYTVTGNTVNWNGLGLDGLITAGLTARLIYWL